MDNKLQSVNCQFGPLQQTVWVSFEGYKVCLTTQILTFRRLNDMSLPRKLFIYQLILYFVKYVLDIKKSVLIFPHIGLDIH